MKKEIIGAPITIGGKAFRFSQAVRAGDLLFVAGQLGVDDKFEVVSDDIRTQTRRALDNLETQLKAGGSAIDKVVKVTAWLTDPEDFAAYNEVYGAVFAEAPPARTTVVSGLLIPGARIELDAIAIVG